MNCADFRRLTTRHGAIGFPDARLHLASCAACQRYADDLRSDNELLRKALAVETPPGLADRILLARGHRSSRGLKWVFAAAVVLVSSATFLGLQAQGSRQLANEMINHVVAEPAALAATGTFPVADLRAALAQAGVELAPSIGQVRYAGECPMPGGVGRHFVIEGSYGRVTLIIGPPGAVPMFALSVARAGFHAELVRARDRAIGIVTTDRRILETVATLLRSS